MKNKINTILSKKVSLVFTTKELLLFGSPLIVLSLLLSYIYFSASSYLVSSLELSLGKNCITVPMVLPESPSIASDNFKVETNRGITLGSRTLFSTQMCVTPKVLLEDQDYKIQVRPFPLLPIRKEIRISIPNKPVLSLVTPTQDPISSRQVLEFNLSQKDEIFNYRLTANEKLSNCEIDNDTLRCELKPLGLKQGTSYEIKVDRYYSQEYVETPNVVKVLIIDPVAVISSSIVPGSVVYDSPMNLSLELNKPIRKLGKVTLSDEKGTEIILASMLSENKVDFRLLSPLVRKSSYQLIVEDAVAYDNSLLNEPYTLVFTVSGGPKVIGNNTPSTTVNPYHNPEIKFDQTIDNNQDFTSIIRLQNGSQVFPIGITKLGDAIKIVPLGGLTTCTTYTIHIDAGVKSIIGVVSDTSYTYSFRTLCYRTQVIGYSVKNRPITSYTFGNGNTKLMFIGALHGSERSTKDLLDLWIKDLDKNINDIPKDITIAVVPIANPDGYSTYSRFNANGVDLNRNFQTVNWKSETYADASTPLPNGGGSHPFSEPETLAISSYISSLNPRVLLSIHSQGGYVIANDAADSSKLAHEYSNLTGYQMFDGGNYEDAFDYEVTGSLEDWARESKNISTLLVELGSHYYHDYPKNSTALWQLLNVR